MLAKLIKLKGGGVIIGAMLTVVALGLATGMAWLPSFTKTAVQVFSGIFIGVQISKKDIKRLGTLIVPVVLLVVGVIAICVGVGLFVHYISRYDLQTALLSSAPGGVVDMTLIGQALGADISVISIIQLFRYSAVVGFFPSLLGGIIKKAFPKKAGESKQRRETDQFDKAEPAEEITNRRKAIRMLLTFIVAAVCGYAGVLSGIPAGALLFSMVGCAVLSLITGKAYMPKNVKLATQIVAGALIGTSITMSAILGLQYAVVPAAIILVGFFVANLLVALILNRFGGLDIMTAVFSSIPGGAQETCLVAEDYGARLSQVSILQVVRSMVVIASYPIIVKLIAGV